jgi:hypothetical protein
MWTNPQEKALRQALAQMRRRIDAAMAQGAPYSAVKRDLASQTTHGVLVWQTLDRIYQKLVGFYGGPTL